MSLPSSYLKLTQLQRIYVDSRMSGMTQIASAAAAGAKNPKHDGSRLERDPKVQAALIEMMERNAEEVGFGRKEAHDMYMEAYQNAETAMEQIAATNALVKLHGLEQPKKIAVEHTHDHKHQIEHMSNDELMKLAGMEGELILDAEYEEVGERELLEAPEVTDDNRLSATDMPDVREDY